MASEHEHQWGFRPSQHGEPEICCTVPGCHFDLKELEQQLAQARALLQDALPHCYRAGDVAFAHKIVAFLARKEQQSE